MISLGRRDARKELGLGLGFGGGREMEDTELEEGEACSDHNDYCNDDDDDDGDGYDSSIDPDIALSYIDVKLQDVLGHFQKDFEGGVSAENLGAKFGGYGSFLPTYQRSPVWSHPRTPPKNQNHNAPRSPNNTQLEGYRRGSNLSSTAPQSVKLEPDTAGAVSLTTSKASPSKTVAVKKESGIASSDLAKNHALRYEPENRKSTYFSDQKLLKVRIKVGSDNLTTQKNAAIYSGLGLDVSPTSSPDESPYGSEGMSQRSRDSPSESPAHILEIMTSFPVCGGLLLSPLPHDLIHLTEVKFHKGRVPFPVHTIDRESSGILLNGSLKDNGKKLGEKKIKSLERNEISAKPKSENYKDSHGSTDVLLKEVELDTLACENLVSNTLKLPLLSNSYSVADAVKGMLWSSNVSREAKKEEVKDKGFSDPIKEETWEDKKANALDNDPVYIWKDDHPKREKHHLSVKSDSNISKGMHTATSELTDMLKQKADHKFNSSEQKGTKFSAKERSSFDGKKKLKGSQSRSIIAADTMKDGLANGFSSVAKNKKSTSFDEYTDSKEFEDLKSQKNFRKSGDRYKDFFGDFELDLEQTQMRPVEMNCGNKQKDSDVGEKSKRCNTTSKERSSSKKSGRLPKTGAVPRTALNVTPSGNAAISDVAHVAAAPAVTEDSWVCCDKCQKWRLLPLGKNPQDLPEKWLCSMLTWLPGMNQCNVSEEETTNAVVALNQVPTLESQSNMPTYSGGSISRVTMVGDQPDLNYQKFGLHVMPGGVKKNTSKVITVLSSNSVKKSIHLSATNASLNEVNEPMVRESTSLNLSKANNLTVEKHKNRQKEKHRILDNCSDGGDTMQLKMKTKRNIDEDLFRVSKKIRADGLPEDGLSDLVIIEKVGVNLSSELPTMLSGKHLPQSTGCSSSKSQVSARSLKEKVSIPLDDVPSDIGKLDHKELGKKRKVKGIYETEVIMQPISNTVPNLLAMGKDESRDNDLRKQKKAKVSRSDGKESSASKGSGKTDRKGTQRKNQQLGKNMGSSVSQWSLDGADFSKRELSVSLHPPVAATSSSSMVSGSYKTKANFLETKGSPVESVSSSPLRVSKLGKLISGQRNITEKYDSSDAGGFSLGGQRQCLDDEDRDGNDRTAAAKKEKILEVAHHGSHASSVLDFQENDSSRVSCGKVKQQIVPCPDVANHTLINGSSDYTRQGIPCSSKAMTSDQCRDDDRQHDNDYHVDGHRPRKSGKGSLRSKDKNRKFNTELDNAKFKDFDSINGHAPSLEVKPTDSKSKNEEKLGVISDESENRYADKKDSVGLLLGESIKKESQSKNDITSIPQQSVLLDSEAVSERGKLPSLLPSGGVQKEITYHCPQPVSGFHKGNGVNVSVSNSSAIDNPSKTLKEIKKVNHPNGTYHSISRDPLANGRRPKDLDAASPVKRDSSSQGAANALKEAKDLKHSADRLKNSGLNVESTGLYFEAVLKFLHAASLLENCSNESAKNGEMIQSMQVYSSTAKLCEFCAHEYEKSKDMAAAALAYKCMEVAYMRVIYSSNSSANKDRHELQTAVQVVPPGESPSSSASDVDNLNHPAATDKGTLAKSISSPHVTGSHVIAAQSRPNFVRFLNFAQEVNFAMEASRKSRAAFTAAISSLGETWNSEGISSIKAALDFNFQDVDGLLRLVRLAIEAISR